MTDDLGDSTPVHIDTTVASSPRIWNYWLGGKDNYEVDRVVGDLFEKQFPAIVDIARSSRAFLSRAITHLADAGGIRQFLDIGTGLPTADNTHQVAQRVAPGSRVVYVDNDPVVLAHARALMVSQEEGETIYIDADLRDTDTILGRAGGLLNLDEPVSLLLLNILGHVPTLDEAKDIAGRLMGRLAPGSFLVVADGTNVVDGLAFQAAIDMWNSAGSLSYHLRSPEQIAELFTGLELLEPGVVSCPHWRPAPEDPAVARLRPGTLPPAVDEFGAVGRKP